MNSKISKRLAFLLAGSALGLAAPAWAQPAAPPGAAPANVDEVVVTARRREETLKDVPVAVSAFTAARLEATGVRDVTDLQKTTPSLTINPARGTNSTLIAFIRGVGQQDPLWGFEPGVGLYVDDVYIARPQAAVLDVFDVQRIEVLRGPQGTLYGRNTVGGAIKYVTARIGSTPELDLKGQFGSYNEHDEIIAGKTPLGSQFAVSAAIAKYDHDGYGKNLTTGAQTYNKNLLAARASIEWIPNSELLFRLSGDQVNDDSNARHGHREAPYTTTAGITYGVLPGVYDTLAGAGDKNTVKAGGVSLLGQWTLNPNYTFKSITAYRSGRTDGNIDFDETPQPFLDIPASYRDHQFTEELQLLFNANKLHGVAGLFYFDGQASGAFDTVLLNGSPTTGFTIFDGGYVNTRSYAAYVDASYDFSDRFQASVGGRYTEDDKTGHVLRQAYLGSRSPFFGNTAAIKFGAPNTDYTNSKVFTKFTPRVSLSYKLSSDLTTYASYSQGFKSGGFDMRGDALAYPATVKGYNPETVDSYEVGLKGNLWNGHGNFAAALFDSQYKNQQITTQYPNTTGGIASVVDNVGASTLRGAEFEGTGRISSDFSVHTAVSYIDTKFDKYIAFIPGAGLTDVSGQRKLQNTPTWTGSLSATWSHDFGGNGKLELTPLASYRSFTQQFETATPLIDQPAYWLYDVDLVWTSASGRYQAGLHGKNLGDQRYKIGGYTFPGATFANSIDAFYGAPRTVTVSLAAKFF
ncbi:MAG: TonB-dependent receptor [Caulobacteraceae bacterium]|nr:TonB-dependent receptor [Caulobacteraceae bacterium]